MEEYTFGPKSYSEPMVGEEKGKMGFRGALARDISVGGDAEIRESLALVARSGGDMQVANGFSAACVAGGNMQVSESMGFTTVAGGNVDADQSMLLTTITGGNVTAKGSFLGIVLGNHLEVGEGSRVLLNTPQAVAFGAALGAGIAVIGWLLRRRTRRSR